MARADAPVTLTNTAITMPVLLKLNPALESVRQTFRGAALRYTGTCQVRSKLAQAAQKEGAEFAAAHGQFLAITDSCSHNEGPA